jgi:hypothetical protein
MSGVLSLYEHMSQQMLPAYRNFVNSWFIVVLFGTSLSGYTLLHASETTAKDFDASV